MNASQILFYIISAFVLGSAVLAVTTLKIFRSAVWLLLSLVGIAALYFWMELEFIAAAQIIVYVGGIVVLIIFSIFLTQETGKEMPKPELKRIIFSLLAALSGLALTWQLLASYRFPATSSTPLNDSVSEIGLQMLSTTAPGYLLPFEVVSILLLSAMIGCIVIAMKPTNGSLPAERDVQRRVTDNAPPPSGSINEPLVNQALIVEEVENE